MLGDCGLYHIIPCDSWSSFLFPHSKADAEPGIAAECHTSGGCSKELQLFAFFFFLQNILEITVSDDDIIHDDDQAIILFDVAKISLGKTVFMAFPLNPEVRTKLEVNQRGKNMTCRHTRNVLSFLSLKTRNRFEVE